MCGDCAPAGGWDRRGFLVVAGGAALGARSRPSAAAPGAGTPPTVQGPPEIRPRRAWAGDVAPAGPVPAEPDVRVLVVHHTVSANDYAASAVVPLLRGMYRFHTGPEKRWPDVAYNFVVDRFGAIWEARAGSLDGAVAGDATGGNQGFDQKCAFLGDHRTDAPSPEAREAMVALLAFLARRHRIDTRPGTTTSFVSRGSNLHPAGAHVETATLTGHRTMSRTACPGDAAMAWVTTELPAAVTSRTPAPPEAPAPVPSTAPAAGPGGATSSTPVPAPSSSVPGPGQAPAPGGSSAPVLGAPADQPLPWLVGGGVAAVVAGAVLRLRSRR